MEFIGLKYITNRPILNDRKKFQTLPQICNRCCNRSVANWLYKFVYSLIGLIAPKRQSLNTRCSHQASTRLDYRIFSI